MGIAEREYMNTEAPEETKVSLWKRFVLFTDRHARLITFLATAVIIAAVLLLVNSYWQSARLKRASQEVHTAATIEALEKAMEKYKDLDLYPVILFKLANRYQEEEEWDKAAQTYEALMADPRVAGTLMLDQAKKAADALKKNREWLERHRVLELNALKLQGGSVVGRPASDPRSMTDPVKEDHPQIRLVTSRGDITVELYEDECPNTVANLIALISEKSPYNGAVWKDVNKGERLQLEIKKERPTHRIAAEKSIREPVVGTLVMDAAAAETNSGVDFQILLKEVPDLKNRTIFGRVVAGLEQLSALKEGDTLKEIAVVRKRTHDYKPVLIPDEPKKNDEKK